MPTFARLAVLASCLLAARGSHAAPDDALPPSTYDLTPHSGDGMAPLGDLEAADRALWSHVGRTLVALAAVVALIYVLARLVLPRFAGRLGRGNGAIRIVERVALDTKHALVLVQVGELEFLVGTGDSGVQLVAELTGSNPSGFAQALAQSRLPEDEDDGSAASGGSHARSN